MRANSITICTDQGMTQTTDTEMSAMNLLMHLNGTELGKVSNEGRLRKHRTTGGLRFMVGTKFDLVKYVAWLAEQKHNSKKIKATGDAYETQKKRAAEHSRKISAAGRDIGHIPAVKNQATRDACQFNFKLFCETYFPLSFTLEWSKSHLKAIAKIQKAILDGGQFAFAMPRGEGKTTITIIGCIWALIYGHRLYLALIAATEPGAVDMMDSIKSELENNHKLGGDFPEICFPIAKLQGKSQLTRGQTSQGVPTKIGWGNKEIKFPTIDGSKCSGSVIKTTGITGHIRGYLKKLKTGESIRPDLVVIDDPQTDESANSIMQNNHRLKLINGAILGLAAAGKKIAAFMPCTVIAEGDMVDQILDHSKFANWQGQRTKMVLSFPTNETLWEEYERILSESFERFGDIRLATQFYKSNRDEMDAGCVVSWEARYDPDELSAIQNAMNLKFRDEETFWAEYQNEPKSQDLGDMELVSAEFLAKKVNGLNRFVVPFSATTLTAGMDVQGKLLYYKVMAWSENGDGAVIDYGVFPKQNRSYFTLKDSKISLRNLIPGGSFTENLNKALEDCVPAIMDKSYFDDNGVEMQISRMLIDANWIDSKDTIYEYIRRSKYGIRLRPSHGRYFGAARAPMSEAKQKPGEKKGLNWVITYPQSKQSIRYVAFDANYWKSWLEDRMRVSMGGSACFTIFGDNPDRHKMLCDQITAEYIIAITAHEKTVNEWKEYPNKPDNHFKDTAVLCCVAASMSGIKIVGIDNAVTEKKKKKKKVKRSMKEEIEKRRRDSQ